MNVGASDTTSARYSVDYINANENTDILTLVERVKNGNYKGNEKLFLGKVTDKVAKKIFTQTEIDVKGFKVAIETRQISHILKDHGENGISDHSMANPSDIAKLEYIIDNHDNISYAGQTQAYKQTVDGKTRAAKTVLYEKRIGKKSYYVVQAVPDTKVKTLYIVTAFIGKSGYKNEASQIINAKNLDVTAKPESANASTTSIRDNSEKVNTSDEKSSKNSSERYSIDVEQSEKETTDNESVGVDAPDASSARYSVGKSFAEQVDEVIAGKHSPTLDLYISKTPSVFLNIGFPDKPMLMRNSKVKEILNKHTEMNTDIIKQIPNAIKNPIMILKSKTNPDVSVVAITDVMTDKGEMIVPVWINQDGVYLDVELDQVVPDKTNFVASAYGRDVKNLLECALENDGFLYLNNQKEKVENLLTRHGLQLSAPLKVSNSTTSIRDNSEKVNTSDEKSSKNSSERYSIDVEQSEKQKRDSNYVTSLRKYLHRLNISEETKAELEERYGEAAAQRILNVWDNTTDEEGISISQFSE